MRLLLLIHVSCAATVHSLKNSEINLTALCLFFRPTLEECIRWKQSFEKLLSSKCKQNRLHSFTSSPTPTPRKKNSTTHGRSRAREEPRHPDYRHAQMCNYISSLPFPQMDCVPSPPSWCPSSARRTLRSTLRARITEIPNPPRNCRPKPRRFSTNSSAVRLLER